LLSKDFAKVIIVASLLALPLAYFAVDQWLASYAIRIHLTAWHFAVPVVIILIIAMATVSFQTFKTALENPVDSLKQE
jgi:putative ABC transport system permease protein